MEQVATLIWLFSPSENWTCTWKAAPRLFKTSSGCSQPRISANSRDTTHTEISFADDPAECQFAAEIVKPTSTLMGKNAHTGDAISGDRVRWLVDGD